MGISLRLETVASFVDKGARIADIGSDHATIPIYLLENNIISFAEAVENKRGPYNRMRSALIESGYISKVYASMSDGIEDLRDDIDTLVIAGMGARLIVRILTDHQEKLGHISTIIIDAHNEREILFEPLRAMGFDLEANSFIEEENVFYDVMKWVKREKAEPYSLKEMEFGPLNLKNQSEKWVKYWHKEITRLQRVLNENVLPEETKKKYEERIKYIGGVIE
ncbi:MAG: class I SAM-dependent methyltransferase [Bacilli bacterium]|nr:class I SAM-dependent methyltransferase [Bacilli bacterium]